MQALTRFECQRLDIQYDDGDILLGQELYHGLANSITPTSHYHNLFVPFILVVLPIIQRASAEDSIRPPDQAQIEQEPNPVDDGLVGLRKVLARLDKSQEEQQRENDGRIECCPLDQACNWVDRQTCPERAWSLQLP